MVKCLVIFLFLSLTACAVQSSAVDDTSCDHHLESFDLALGNREDWALFGELDEKLTLNKHWSSENSFRHLGQAAFEHFKRQSRDHRWIYWLRQLSSSVKRRRKFSRPTLHGRFCANLGSEWNWQRRWLWLEGNVSENFILNCATSFILLVQQRRNRKKQQFKLPLWILLARDLFTS